MVRFPLDTLWRLNQASTLKHLDGNRTRQELPDVTIGPRFELDATNLQSGGLRHFARAYRFGEIRKPGHEVTGRIARLSTMTRCYLVPPISPIRLRRLVEE
ncbi:MAG TPA: hypothetical protein VHG52_13205 [Thermomicrobiales bacterium]|nr:hypothetical protein [Thermomicrobiales bacterium]